MNLTLQKGINHTNEIVWLMLDEDYQVVEPIQRYLTFLTTSRSPNTVEAYAYDLKSWWEFLSLKALDWHNVNLSDVEDFAYWLRVGDTTKVVSMQPVQAIRSEKTVNRAITAITSFYEYHIASGRINFKQFDRFHLPHGINQKGLLTGIAKSKPTRQKLVKLKEPKSFPGCLSDEQIETIVNACHRLRDKLMILMLNGTGMRKGELLGLCHEDIGDGSDNFIRVVRRNNPNGARVKGQERTIPVVPELLKMYNDYLIYEYPEPVSDYVSKLGTLRDSFRVGSIKSWFNIDPDIIRDADYPKYHRGNPDPISNTVRKQIEENLHLLPDPIARMWLIGYFSAMRPLELALLKQDCLVREGQYWKLVWQRKKTNDQHEIPISRTIAQVVQEQQEYIKDLWGEEWDYLFCHYHNLSRNETSQPKLEAVKRVIPSSNKSPLLTAIRTLVKALDIRDENGQLAKFQSKLLRPTRLTETFVTNCAANKPKQC